MKPTQDSYPVFEANQVLTSEHLNKLFAYLEEQERLTRANLIGIGIVCGLEVQLDAARHTIRLSKGCGITSAGYLIAEPSDVELVSCRKYTLPNKLDYPPLKDASLWELFPSGEPDTIPLGTHAGFLEDKAVLLFLELKWEPLRNCSPTNCDDKGAAVTATVRRLLIRIEDLKTIVAEANGLGTGLTDADLAVSLQERLNLPDLRLPRVDVPNTGLVTSAQVLKAFHAVFRANQLVRNTQNALDAAYSAFKPILQAAYPKSPFDELIKNFGFLDQALQTSTQAGFLQYYYGLFGDLLNAYDEFREKGVEWLCACCPPEGLFPRHLMAGPLMPASLSSPNLYRHAFLPSPAVGTCEERRKELELLFRRMVEMMRQFTDSPLPRFDVKPIASHVRITPSTLGDVPLSDTAIPYYYRQDGAPPLYRLWNPDKTRLNRANQNLSYRSDQYRPPAPLFVTNALRYNLDPYNFLRIEGHLGKPYQDVLKTLLSQKTQSRLPIEIVALRTGVFDEKLPLDVEPDECRFADLSASYGAFRKGLLFGLCEAVIYLYETPMGEKGSAGPGGGTPQLPLLKQYAPQFRYKDKTVGAWFERHLAHFASKPYIDVDQSNIDLTTVVTTFGQLFVGTTPPQPQFFAYVVAIYYVQKLAEAVPAGLTDDGFTDFGNKYEDLTGLVRYFRSHAEHTVSQELAPYIPQERLIDRCDQLLSSCNPATIKALHDEYARRVREAKQKQLLSVFLRNNPGIQHRAGVPLGGTFLVVYHGRSVDRKGALKDASDKDIRFERLSKADGGVDPIIESTVNDLPDGTVIADFYLPYLCCSDCPPVQFILPIPPLTFTADIASCTDPESGEAKVNLTVTGGTWPVRVQVDGQADQPFQKELSLSAGSHVLRMMDAAGTVSAPQTIVVPEALRLAQPAYTCDDEGKYQAAIPIKGGVPPYTTTNGTVVVKEEPNGTPHAVVVTHPIPSGEKVSLEVRDSRGCPATIQVQHTCPLTVTVAIGCTDLTSGKAEVSLTVTGGTPPYRVHVDGQAVQKEGVSLGVGSYAVEVLDAAGVAFGPHKIQVPRAVQLEGDKLRYECDSTGAHYQATIPIEGGVPPYTTTKGEVVVKKEPNGTPHAVVVTDQIRSGEKVSIEVRDSRGCPATIEVQHTCCTWPCGGASTQCAYRLWIQPLPPEILYKSYRSEGAIRFKYKVREFTFSSDLVAADPTKLNNHRDFDATMTDLITKLNKHINAAIKQQGGTGKVELSYPPKEGDPFACLRIESFDCETFSLQFDYSFALSDEMRYEGRVEYTSQLLKDGPPFKGAIFTDNKDKTETRVPAFDCRARNQCTGTDYVNLCQGGKPRINILPDEGKDNGLTVIGQADKPDNVVSYVWDCPGAARPFYEGKRVTIQNGPTTSQILSVQLTAITKDGCFAVKTVKPSQLGNRPNASRRSATISPRRGTRRGG